MAVPDGVEGVTETLSVDVMLVSDVIDTGVLGIDNVLVPDEVECMNGVLLSDVVDKGVWKIDGVLMPDGVEGVLVSDVVDK